MGLIDRSKKKDLLWKKAILHFALCFVMGFFTGFAPTTTTDTFFHSKTPEFPPLKSEGNASLNRSLMVQSITSSVPLVSNATNAEEEFMDEQVEAPKLLIIVTTTATNDTFKPALLGRLAHTLRLVPAPLLWMVVESRLESQRTAEMLRLTGIMYRHVVFGENFTDATAEVEHQRKLALSHIEHHRLDGIVHFAELSNFYDLDFFEEIRDIESFGTWPVASVSSNRKRVAIEGPVCQLSEVVGWHFHDPNDDNIINRFVSSFAFNSSILWDPERWGRSSSIPDTTQDSMKFVQQALLEDESKVMAFPEDCSRVMLWRVHVPRSLVAIHNNNIPSDANQPEVES